MMPLFLAVLLACTAFAGGAQTSPSDRDAIVASVQKFFDTMTARDAAGAASVLVPEGRFFSVRDSDEGPRMGGSTFRDYLDGLAKVTQRRVERMWDPEVRVHGRIATVWTRYDFHIDGKFSHCGVDAFDLVKTQEGWKISGAVYTVERTGCPPSPLGPLPKE
jgi:putative lumazine-binding protein